MLLIEGFTQASSYAQIQHRTSACCHGIKGVHFIYPTQSCGDDGRRPVSIVSLTTSAALEFASRHWGKVILEVTKNPASSELVWIVIMLPEAE